MVREQNSIGSLTHAIQQQLLRFELQARAKPPGLRSKGCRAVRRLSRRPAADLEVDGWRAIGLSNLTAAHAASRHPGRLLMGTPSLNQSSWLCLYEATKGSS